MDLLVECPFLVFRVTTPELAGESAAEGLIEQLILLVELAGARNVIVDLSQVRYLSSVGLRPLLKLRLQLGRLGGRVVLCGLQPSVLEVMRTTRLVSLENGSASAASLFAVLTDIPSAVTALCISGSGAKSPSRPVPTVGAAAGTTREGERGSRAVPAVSPSTLAQRDSRNR